MIFISSPRRRVLLLKFTTFHFIFRPSSGRWCFLCLFHPRAREMKKWNFFRDVIRIKAAEKHAASTCLGPSIGPTVSLINMQLNSPQIGNPFWAAAQVSRELFIRFVLYRPLNHVSFTSRTNQLDQLKIDETTRWRNELPNQTGSEDKSQNVNWFFSVWLNKWQPWIGAMLLLTVSMLFSTLPHRRWSAYVKVTRTNSS